MTKTYILKKPYQYITDVKKIITIPTDSVLRYQSERYIVTIPNEESFITCFLEKSIVENNPEYFEERSNDEVVLDSLINDIKNFFKSRGESTDLANYAYDKIMMILCKKDELLKLQAENAKLQSEIFILKMKDSGTSTPFTPYVPFTPYIPYQTQFCNVCNIDLTKNTHYVCMNSACPSRIIYTYTNSTGGGSINNNLTGGLAGADTDIVSD